MEKYGFVYIWRDRKYNRYYIGCHWGNENDGYICSSSWMKNVYKYRSQDFKRRILSRIYTNKKDLLKEEFRWLLMIKSSELKKKYYNIHNHHFSHWSTDPEKFKEVSKKNSIKNIGRKLTEESIVKRTATRKKTYIQHSEETKKKMSVAAKGKEKSKSHREKLREVNLGKKYNHEINLKKGRKKRYVIQSPEGLQMCVEGLENFCKNIDVNLNSFLYSKKIRGWLLIEKIHSHK